MIPSTFAAALLDPGLPPPGLAGSDERRRRGFAVYRNNVASSLADALADSFPVCRELVGEDFFRAMAVAFARARMPRSPCLDEWIAGFPEFVAGFGPARGLAYLADVARLELLVVGALHAADGAPLPAEEIAARLAVPGRLPGLRVGLLPSVGVLSSRHAVVSIWHAHQGVRRFDFEPGAEEALVLRAEMAVRVLRLPAGGAGFVAALGEGAALAEAAERGYAAAAGFDLTAALTTLIGERAIGSLADTGA